MMYKTSNKLIFIFTFLSVTLSTELTTKNEFVVVSTSPTPQLEQKNESQFCSVQHIVESLQTQNEQIQNTLDTQVNDKLYVLEEQTRIGIEEVQKLKVEVEAQRKLLESNAELFQGLEKQIMVMHRAFAYSKSLPEDCKEVQNRGYKDSGIYHIRPKLSSDSFDVLCDMQVQEGGWTYIMNRFDGSQDFFQNWTNYKHGFGNLFGEFWLGLEHIYELTNYKNNELLIELVDWDNKKVHAHYKNFSIGNEKKNYALKVLGGYSGDAKDSFSYHLNMNFSTADNNKSQGGYCASYFRAAWWYKACFTSHLTGTYLGEKSSMNAKLMGIHWNGFHKFDYSYSLKQARMMIRPSADSPVLLPHEKIK